METKQVLRKTKNVVLGRNKPPMVLRFLCWFTIIWDTVIGLWMLGSGFFIAIKPDAISSNGILKDFSKELFFILGGLHIVSLLSAILMYRLKKFGFWIYCISNISMVIVPIVMLSEYKKDYVPITFTLAMIALFSTQLKKLN